MQRSAILTAIVAASLVASATAVVVPLEPLYHPTVRQGDRRLASVTLENDQKVGFSYSSTFQLGGKSASFLMDTGSSDIWILRADNSLFSSIGQPCCSSSQCCTSSLSCQGRTQTSTCTFSILYGSGTASGQIGLTSMVVGGQTIPKIQVGDAASAPEGVQAIMGLGFPSLATYTAPVIADVFKTFTFQFDPSPTATSGNNFLLGADANVALPSGIVWKVIPLLLTDQTGHWTVGLPSVKVGNTSIVSATNKSFVQSLQTAIIDSGTSFIQVPSVQYRALLAAITTGNNCGTVQTDNQQSLQSCASLDGLPSMTITMGSGDQVTSFTLSPQSYTLRSGNGFIILIGEGGSRDDQWIMGLTFMRAYPFTKFDRSTDFPSVSVACAASGCAAAPPQAKGFASSSTTWSTKNILLIAGVGLAGLVGLTLIVMGVLSAVKKSKRRAHAAQHAQYNNAQYYPAATPTVSVDYPHQQNFAAYQPQMQQNPPLYAYQSGSYSSNINSGPRPQDPSRPLRL